MELLAKAILGVMQDVKGIDKSMNVGSGSMSYKGVPDFEVKKILGESMVKHGLCVMPIDIEESTQVDRWEEASVYNGQSQIKQKQSIFTKAKVKFLLVHESGQSQVICGYGHGVDSQDKGAGKATTYALKYAMLYTFFVPTGKIDDSDNAHSDNAPVKPKQEKQTPVKKEELTPTHPKWKGAIQSLVESKVTISQIRVKYDLSQNNEELLLSEATK